MTVEVENRDDWQLRLEGLLAEGAFIRNDFSRRWKLQRQDLRRVILRAKKVAAEQPGRAAGWFTVGRLLSLDLGSECARSRPASLAYLRRALTADAGYLPALVLLRNLLEYFGSFGPRPRYLAAATRLAEELVRRTESHPAAVTQLKVARDFQRDCAGLGEPPTRERDERLACRELEASVAAQAWDGLRNINVLPLW